MAEASEHGGTKGRLKTFEKSLIVIIFLELVLSESEALVRVKTRLESYCRHPNFVLSYSCIVKLCKINFVIQNS